MCRQKVEQKSCQIKKTPEKISKNAPIFLIEVLGGTTFVHHFLESSEELEIGGFRKAEGGMLRGFDLHEHDV